MDKIKTAAAKMDKLWRESRRMDWNHLFHRFSRVFLVDLASNGSQSEQGDCDKKPKHGDRRSTFLSGFAELVLSEAMALAEVE